MVYKSLHELAAEYLTSKFERRETAYNRRDSENKLNVPLLRTNYYKNSFSYSGAILWNSLSCDLRKPESLKQFKRLLKGDGGVRHGIRGKQLFLINFPVMLDIRH